MRAAGAENINWISNLKWIALYAVIALHCTAPLLMQYGKVSVVDWWVADFFNAIVRFAVPVFVMITGALLLHREYETSDFLKKRLGRVVIPFLFWSMVYIWYSWYNEDIKFGNDYWLNIKLVFHQLKYGSSYHLWYVYMLIGLYFFIPVISKFVQNATEKEVLYFLIVWFTVMLITQPYLVKYDPAVDMHYFAGFAGYLVLGHYLAYKTFRVKHLRLWVLLFFIVGVVWIAAGTRLLLNYPQWPGTMFYEPVNPAVLMLSSSIFVLVRFTVPKVHPAMIRLREFAGRFNYGIFLSHALVLYLFDDLFGISYKFCTPVIAIPLTALLCFALSLLLVWIINKLPFGKWVSG